MFAPCVGVDKYLGRECCVTVDTVGLERLGGDPFGPAPVPRYVEGPIR
jgi:hypothetical protein